MLKKKKKKRWKHLGDILNCIAMWYLKKKGMSPLQSGGQTSLGVGEERGGAGMGGEGGGSSSKLGLL